MNLFLGRLSYLSMSAIILLFIVFSLGACMMDPENEILGVSLSTTNADKFVDGTLLPGDVVYFAVDISISGDVPKTFRVSSSSIQVKANEVTNESGIIEPTIRVTAVSPGENVVTVSSTVDSSQYFETNIVVVDPSITNIKIYPDMTNVLVGTTVQLRPTLIIRGVISNTNLNWFSSRNNIARVDANGIVTGVGRGTTTVTVSSVPNPNVLGRATIMVGPPIVEEVTIVPATNGVIAIFMGESNRLTARVTGMGAVSQLVTWRTSSSSIATVDSNGILSGVGLGQATITATSTENPSISNTITVTVKRSVVQAVAITPVVNIAIFTGESNRLTATVMGMGAVSQSVTWSTSSSGIATVDSNGIVRGVGVGTATITATSVEDTNHSATATVMVPASRIVSVSISSTISEIVMRETVQLMANVQSRGVISRAVTWSSSDTNVATVDTNGIVRGIINGITRITATSVADGNKSATHDLAVISRIEVYGYRLTVSTPNSDTSTTDVILQVAEGGIHDGSNMVDLLAGVDPTTDTTVEHGGPVEKFNDGSDNQSLAQLFHSVQDTTTKTIQVLGSSPLTASSGVFRIRIIGRDSFQERGNGIVVTLLDENGNPIGTASDTSSGFVKNNGAHDGFVVDFRTRDGAVLTQPTIFDLSGSLPALPDAN